MLDDSGLLNIRVKDIQVSYLSSETIQKNKLYWQVINVLIPLILLLCFGLGFRYYRKQKYTT
jgi:protein involved in gliding motility GldG